MPSSSRRFPAPWSAELQPNYYVVRDANGSRFGISARRRLPNGNSEQLTHSGDIEWYDTLEECKARAERILHGHQVRVH